MKPRVRYACLFLSVVFGLLRIKFTMCVIKYWRYCFNVIDRITVSTAAVLIAVCYERNVLQSR